MHAARSLKHLNAELRVDSLSQIIMIITTEKLVQPSGQQRSVEIKPYGWIHNPPNHPSQPIQPLIGAAVPSDRSQMLHCFYAFGWRNGKSNWIRCFGDCLTVMGSSLHFKLKEYVGE